MKKIIAVLLAALMCFALTACGAQASDYKAATALLAEGKYEEAITAFEALGDYKDSAAKLEEAKLGLEKATAIALLCKGTWFYNGGTINCVNHISFTEDAATVGSTYYDGNGRHDKEDVTGTYTLDGKTITVTLADATELKIDYTVKDGKIKLGKNEYFTVSQVKKGLEGYWGLRTAPSYVGGVKITGSEYIYHFKDGKVVFEYATEANALLGYEAGTYFYYGPKEGTYKVDETGLTVEASNNWQFGFNIIDGEVTFIRCDKVCSRVDGFKGENGYSF